MRRTYQDFPTDQIPGMRRAKALENARQGIAHRSLCDTPSLFLGVAETADWSPIWGLEATTSNALSISFPRHAYAISSTGRRFLASPGNALFINPNTTFRRDARHRANIVNDFLTVEPAMLLDVLREWDPSCDEHAAPFPWTDVPLDEHAFRVQRLLVAYALCGDGPDPLVVEDVGIHLLRHLVSNAYRRAGVEQRPKKPSTDRAHRDAVEAAKEYVAANLAQPLRLRDIARAAGVAPAHFCGIFRRVTEQTVNAYVRSARLRAAYDLLPDFRGNLTRLALELGFADGNQFSTAFRRVFGESPSVESRRTTTDDAETLLAALTQEIDRAAAT